MENNWIPLFYDKYCGDHNFDNPLTQKITFDSLDDDKYYHIFDNDAVNYFNDTFNNFNKLPLKLDNKLYRVSVHHLIEKKKVVEFYTVVEVNSSVLPKYDYDKVPNLDFLIKLAITHFRYNNQNKYQIKEQQVEQNIINVTTQAMIPITYYDDPQIESPKEINVELFKYQKCSIHWMLEKEKNPQIIKYILSDQISIGKVAINLNQKKIVCDDELNSLTFYGGGVIDEVGLGKTLQITTLSILNQRNDISYINKNIPNYFCSRATLIIAPSHLCGQWERELYKMISPDQDIKVIKIVGKVNYEKINYQDLCDADFVIVSYTFFDNSSYVNQWNPSKNYHKNNNFEIKIVQQYINKLGEQLLKKPITNLIQTSPIIKLIHWHRIVVDEFHEIFTQNKNLPLKNQLPLFKSNYKWCVTATPFCNHDNLYNILEFLTCYQNRHKKMIFLSEKILLKMAEDTFRRNTKENVENEYILPNIVEEIIWLKFSPTERMLYNAYLADPNNDNFSVYLRQLCCHPKLAEETKHTLSNCKTLADIENIMVLHYKTQVDLAESKVNKIKQRIEFVEKKLQKAIRRKKRKEKKSDKYPDSNSDTDSDEDEIPNLEENIFDNQDDEQIFQASIVKRPSIQTLKDSLVLLNIRLTNSVKIFDGKKITYNFFTNVVERIRRTAKKESIAQYNNNLNEDENVMMMIENQIRSNDDDKNTDEEEICVICMGVIMSGDIGVTNCGHIYCFSCLKIMISKTPKCPQCLKHLKQNEVFMLDYEQPVLEKKIKTPEQMTKDELIDKVGTKLANLILFLKNNDVHTIIFSQWDDLLRKVGKILSENGIKNIFCKGNVFQRDKAIRDFNDDKNMKVIMLSSERAASGTNLTKAKQVILLDPVYGDYKYRKSIETQAIGRAYRLGQSESVKVVRFIISDTVEEIIYAANIEDNKKYNGIE
jgi:SNF2 family DNA or RNA helicase